MKRLILICSLAIYATFLFGQILPSDKLLGPATSFMQQEHPSCKVISMETIAGNDNLPLGYLLNFSPSGFMILSASEKVGPVVGYARNGSCELPAGEKAVFISWITKGLQSGIHAWNSLNPYDRQKITNGWKRFLDQKFDSKRFEQWPPEGSTSTEGWIETNWTQSAPYNSMCPMDLNAGARSVVGCPATAMAQILNFHKKIHQTRLNDDDDYYHNYGAGNKYWIDNDHQARGFPDFDSLNIYLEEMELIYSSGESIEWPLTAVLSFACGVTARQVYTAQVSGTFGLDQALSSLQRFGYDESRLVLPEDTTLNSLVAENIKIALPVQLGLLVDGGSGGHNVVADGYNTDEYFHFNFGWGGYANGWYTLPPASIPYNLTIIEGAVLDIIPDINTGSISRTDPSKQPALFPNPVVREFRVSGLKSPATISIYDLNGILVLTAGVASSSTTVGVSRLSPGRYIYKLEENGSPCRSGILIKETNFPD